MIGMNSTLEQNEIAVPPADRATSDLRRPRISVAHLLHTVAYGGPETILINWIKAQDRSAFDVHLLCFADSNGSEEPFVTAARNAGLTVHFIPWNRRKPVLRSATQLANFIRSRDVDILHCYNSYAELVGVAAKRMTGVRLITTKWMWGKLDWKRAILQQVERLILPQFDVVTAQSEFAARLTSVRGKRNREVKVLLSGIDQPVHAYTNAERELARAALGAAPDHIVLLHVARFYPEKAHDVLIHSFLEIAATEPRARLWLTGVGPLLGPTKTMVRDLGLESHVRFLGFRSDLDRLLPLADLQIHSSNIEGIPLALCSGLFAGIPVVATAVGGVPEIVHDGITGLLVPPNDPSQLADAALRVMRDASLRATLSEGARSFMRNNYSIQAAVRRLELLYEGMVYP